MPDNRQTPHAISTQNPAGDSGPSLIDGAKNWLSNLFSNEADPPPAAMNAVNQAIQVSRANPNDIDCAKPPATAMEARRYDQVCDITTGKRL